MPSDLVPSHPVRHLVALGVLASVADAATTWLVIQVAAVDARLVFLELNPAMRSAIDLSGHVPAMALRVLAGLAAFGFLAWASRRSRWGRWPLATATVLTCGVVAWNIRVLATTIPVA